MKHYYTLDDKFIFYQIIQPELYWDQIEHKLPWQ